MKIAIQGVKGSFHDIAASKFFKKIDYNIVEYKTFEKLVNSVFEKKNEFGLIAVENSIVGDIGNNYELIKDKIQIIGELSIKIKHHLIALHGQNIKNIKTIISHPMAIKQCSLFLTKNKIQAHKYYDTAGAVEHIKKNMVFGLGAISTKISADINGLKIYKKNIQNIPKNFTRFFVITHKDKLFIKTNDSQIKSSIFIKMDDTENKLFKILNVITNFKIKIVKIKSMLIKNNPWNYNFFIDFKFKKLKLFHQMIKKIKKYTIYINIIGIY